VIHLDTSFLIDVMRETSAERPAAAWEFIESLPEDEVLAMSVHAVCEIRAGAELSRRAMQEREVIDRHLSGLLVVYPDDRFAAEYARVYAQTSRAGRPIAAMDLLIATAALLDHAPLVTRNVKDFSRVPGLRVLRY
jgi:predicted nucleic acid-binding protein